MNITVDDLTGKECGEIAITAAEGGIGYWSQIERYQYTRWMPDLPNGDMGDCIEVNDEFVFYTLHVINDDEDGYQPEGIDITPALIKRGFEVGLKADRDKGGWMIQRLIGVDRESWFGDIDSSDADMLIQWGVFGELVYG